jgi:hypothetical protein
VNVLGQWRNNAKTKALATHLRPESVVADSKETDRPRFVFQSPQLLGILVALGNQAGKATFICHDGWGADRGMS